VNVDTQLWMASAPQYVHLLAHSGTLRETSSSRAQAIDRIVRALTEQLAA
jgi:hypothetical protein